MGDVIHVQQQCHVAVDLVVMGLVLFDVPSVILIITWSIINVYHELIYLIVTIRLIQDVHSVIQIFTKILMDIAILVLD